MGHIERSIEIDAPVETVFSEFEDINRWLEWWPRLRHVKGHRQGKLTKQATFDWSHGILGTSLDGQGTITDIVPNQHVHMESKGSIESNWSVSFAASGNKKTKLTVAADYTLPGGAVGTLADKSLVERLNDKELQHGLENLKDICEHRKNQKK